MEIEQESKKIHPTAGDIAMSTITSAGLTVIGTILVDVVGANNNYFRLEGRIAQHEDNINPLRDVQVILSEKPADAAGIARLQTKIDHEKQIIATLSKKQSHIGNPYEHTFENSLTNGGLVLAGVLLLGCGIRAVREIRRSKKSTAKAAPAS
ncbi:MAG: hypothetical protein ACXWLH_00300 [Candidatus Saccharimonadales bacterium]